MPPKSNSRGKNSGRPVPSTEKHFALPPAHEFRGFVAMSRANDVVLKLIEANPNAFILATVIAMRARYREKEFDPHGLQLGEAFIGDHQKCGLTRQEYRTAQKFLIRHAFATCRPTTKGTIARLIDSRLFDPLGIGTNHQSNHRPTIGQPSPNHQPTTNEPSNQETKGTRSDQGPAGAALCVPSETEMEKQCWEIAERLELERDDVGKFIEQHRRDGWKIDGKPIQHLEKTLVGFCEKLKGDRKRVAARNRAAGQSRNGQPCNYPNGGWC
jgi:hypothetical protein